MAGLMNQQQPQQGAAPQQPGMASPPPQEADEQTNVTPEEQAEYEQFVTNGMTLMYSEEVMPQVVETIRGDGNPIEGLGNALAMIVMRLEDSAEEKGAEISGDVKLHGAQELLEQMVELAEAAGVHEFSQQEMESAFYFGLDLYRSTRQEQGKLPVAELQQDMQELMAADQQGRADEVLPGISEYAERAPQPEDVQAAGQQPAQRG